MLGDPGGHFGPFGATARIAGRAFGRYEATHEEDIVSLDCTACARDPELQKYLGCGTAPIITVEREPGVEEEVEWGPVFWRELCQERNMDPMSAKDAELFYAPANWANRMESGSQPWWTCPRYYDEFAESGTNAAINAVVEMSWWADRGQLAAVAELPLHREEARHVRSCLNLMEALRDDNIARARSGGDDE